MRIEAINRGDPGWSQFQRMVLGGVPHAVAIARALSRSPLTVPMAPEFDASQADLPFYGPVHQAYRRGALGEFLGLMEALRVHPLWEHFKFSRAAQLAMVDDCLVHVSDYQQLISQRLDQWFGLAHGEVARFGNFMPACHAAFAPNSRAA